jgi:hypothetical protein
LIEDLQRQQQDGQVEAITNANGDTVVKVKRWLNPQTLAELGRTCARIAALLNIGESGPDGEGSASFSSTTINLVSPGSAAEFGARAQELAAARQAEPAPIDVSVAQEPPSTPPEASAQPEPPEAPSEPILEGLEEIDVEACLRRVQAERGNGTSRPSRRAQKGTQQPRGPRFLPAPQRN